MTTQMGPVISEQSRDRIQTMISDAKLQGAELLTGGYVPVLPPPFDRGYYIPPTILAVNSSMTIWKDEVFGPVVVAQSFRTEEEAIELANDSPYGLAGIPFL
jgi:acyl-CoA reductase-like NAD-dependent aldehyde dehydrogenase